MGFEGGSANNKGKRRKSNGKEKINTSKKISA